MIGVVIFGSVPLATWVARQVMAHERLDLLGVVCKPESNTFAHHGLDEPGVYDFSLEHDIPVVALDEVAALLERVESAGGISVRFHQILRADVINLFDRGIINTHGGELPRFRGVNCANHALLEGAERGAGTLHYIDPGVDTGDIVHREYFDIEPTDTAYDVFLKTQAALMASVPACLDAIARNDVPRTTQETFLAQGEAAATYRKTDLADFREIEPGMASDEMDRRARAFSFPGHEHAYIRVGDRRLYVVPQEVVRDA